MDNALLLAKQYDIAFKEGSYLVAVMRCTRSWLSLPQKQTLEIVSIIKNASLDKLLFVSYMLDRELVMVTFTRADSDLGDLCILYENIAHTLSEKFEDISFYFGMGNPVTSIDKIYTSYHEAADVLFSRSVRSKEHVFHAGSSGDAVATNYTVPIYFEQQVYKCRDCRQSGHG